MEHHGGTIFFYPVAILVGFFPWSVFAIPAGDRHRTAIASVAIGFHRRLSCWPCVLDRSLCRVVFARADQAAQLCHALLSGAGPLWLATMSIAGVGRQRRWPAAGWWRPLAACRWWESASRRCVPLVGKGVFAGRRMAGADRPAAAGRRSRLHWTGRSRRSYRAAAGSFAFTAVPFVTLLFAMADSTDRPASTL